MTSPPYHRAAAKVVLARMAWWTEARWLVTGVLPGGGYVHVPALS